MPTMADAVGIEDYRLAEGSQEYTYHRGTTVMPLSNGGHAVVRLHGGVGYRTMRFDYGREGRPPLLPTMADGNRDTLLSATLKPRTPTPDTNDGYNWRVSGEYVFVQNTPRVGGTDAFPAGNPPFGHFKAAKRAYDITPSGAIVTSGGDPVGDTINNMGSIVSQTYGTDWFWPYTGLPNVIFSDYMFGG